MNKLGLIISTPLAIVCLMLFAITAFVIFLGASICYWSFQKGIDEAIVYFNILKD